MYDSGTRDDLPPDVEKCWMRVGIGGNLLLGIEGWFIGKGR